MDGQQGLPLIAFNESGQEVTDRYFSIENNQLQVIRSTMPSMLTLDEQVIKQDCLCYLMERITVG
jgi:CO dehydrogenase/acetyl-CoA synthase alpha subunit